MPRFTGVFLAALLFAAGTALRAEDAAPEPPVSVQFILFGWQSTVPELRYSAKDKTEAIGEPYGTTSVHTYVGPAKLSFYAASAKLSPDAPAPQPAATVTFPRTATRFILVTARAADGRYQMYAVPQDDAALQPPYIKFHNFTDLALAIRLGQQPVVQLDPRGTAVVKPDAKANIVLVAMLREDRWRKLFSNVIELNDDGHQNVIFAPGLGRPAALYILPPWPVSNEPASSRPPT